jgi:hypothetical protein
MPRLSGVQRYGFSAERFKDSRIQRFKDSSFHADPADFDDVLSARNESLIR